MERLEVPFQGIAQGIVNLGNHFSNFLNVVNIFKTNVGTWFSDLGDNISDWFSDLGSNIGTWFSNLGGVLDTFKTNVGDWFLNLGSNIGTWFTNLSTSLGNWFVNLGNTLTNLLSYINPFNENFFGYKIIDLFSDLLEFLFVPTQNPISELATKFNEKFAFINQIKSVITNFFDDKGDTNTVPNWSITYYGTTVNIVDWSAFEPFRNTFHSIVLGVCWFAFIFRLYRRIPGIIGAYHVENGKE